MKDINGRLIKAYKAVSVSKILYDGAPFYKRLEFIMLVPAIFAFAIITQIESSPFSSYLVLLTSIILTAGSIVTINQYFKWILSKKKIKTEKKISEHWLSEDFLSLRLKAFYLELKSRKLIKSKKTEIELLDEYIRHSSREAKFYYTRDGVLIGGTVILLFILPVWGELIKHLFDPLQEDFDVFKSLQLIMALISFIYIVIYLLFLLKKGLNQFMNSTSTRYTSIERLLVQLRLNLILKKIK